MSCFGVLGFVLAGLGCGGSGPQVVATGLLDDPSAGLAARDGEVYAVDAKGTLLALRADGGSTPLVADAGLGYVIKADADHVYWTEGTTARLVPLDGGSPRVLGSAPTGWNLQDLGASGGRLFWIETTTDPALPVQTRLSRAYFLGPLPNATIDTVDGLAFSFATDADSLYWAGTMGAWRRELPDDATASLARVSDPVVAGNVVSDGTHIFWTEQDPKGDALYSRTVAGGAPVKLAEIARARALAVDAPFLYLRTDRSAQGSCIERVPLQGGESVPIAQASADGFSLAVDADAVFWLEKGQLLRLDPADIAPDPGLCGG